MRPWMRLALWWSWGALASVGTTTVAAAQSDPGPALVLVVEGAAGRLSVARLRRALGAVLDRHVVRVTDAEAEAAPLRLTIAFAAPRSWTLVLEGSERHSRSVDIRGTALETLVGVAVDLVRGAERAGTTRAAPRSAAAPPAALTQPWSSERVDIASEILDPFAGLPVQRVVIAAASELLDPFVAVGSAVRVARSPEVLDPWR
jgi:hypothetical protein